MAADFAASAAAIVVRKEGTTTCSIEELRLFLSSSSPTPPLPSPALPLSSSPTLQKNITDTNQLITVIADYRKAGYKIVFTNGCFDILHAGHVSYLNRAKALGDILIIGVNSDNSIRRIKGETRPINSLEDRIQVLGGLACVDYLIAFNEDTPINLIRLVQPDIYVKGGDYTIETLPEAPVIQQFGGVVKLLPFLENRSTTEIIKKLYKTINRVQVQHN